jgi:hypothetical protein
LTQAICGADATAMTRRAALRAALVGVPLLALAACADEPAPAPMPPLHYEYLTPLRLNVASIEVENHYIPGTQSAELSAEDPAPPLQTLSRLATDRLHAFGASGRAVFVIEDASLRRDSGGHYSGSVGVTVQIFPAGATGPAAYASARVVRATTTDSDDEPRVLYTLTSQLMDALNIELEYQVRHTLGAWLITTPGAPQPAPVEQAPLPPPPA